MNNTSAAAFVVGGASRRVQDVNLRTLGIVLEKNGEIVELAAGAAVLGHPAESIVMLANMLARKDEVIPAGTFIMTGGVTAAVGFPPLEAPPTLEATPIAEATPTVEVPPLPPAPAAAPPAGMPEAP